MQDKELKGLVQVYTGDGKGKTTAALGLALRAAGHGMKVIIFQFLKGQPGGEHYFNDKSNSFKIIQVGQGDIFQKPDAQLLSEATQTLELARKAIVSGDYDVIILDEIFIAHWRGFISQEQILELMKIKPGHVELIMTGRKAPAEVIKQADLVTEMLMIKHPFAEGIQQRKGIEY
ncbi:MAG: cob(I)yrinic acid a,c-diamide adenosyltransferase [Dehalococcoidia bacterium]|nr:cob(I)yrinic acid a,c-diamide adenosyltransferase [Dehalococcoidia bacterium]MDD5493121.1 cob(I)yrinic acid a,c-diamide adenosyltransferase [Dehalococcoidia bacterium]